MATDSDLPINAEYRVPRGLAGAWGLMGGLVMIGTGLVLTFLLASFLQWRTDTRAEFAAASHARLVQEQHSPVHTQDVRVGALR